MACKATCRSDRHTKDAGLKKARNSGAVRGQFQTKWWFTPTATNVKPRNNYISHIGVLQFFRHRDLKTSVESSSIDTRCRRKGWESSSVGRIEVLLEVRGAFSKLQSVGLKRWDCWNFGAGLFVERTCDYPTQVTYLITLSLASHAASCVLDRSS